MCVGCFSKDNETETFTYIFLYAYYCDMAKNQKSHSPHRLVHRKKAQIIRPLYKVLIALASLLGIAVLILSSSSLLSSLQSPKPQVEGASTSTTGASANKNPTIPSGCWWRADWSSYRSGNSGNLNSHIYILQLVGFPCRYLRAYKAHAVLNVPPYDPPNWGVSYELSTNLYGNWSNYTDATNHNKYWRQVILESPVYEPNRKTSTQGYLNVAWYGYNFGYTFFKVSSGISSY